MTPNPAMLLVVAVELIAAAFVFVIVFLRFCRWLGRRLRR